MALRSKAHQGKANPSEEEVCKGAKGLTLGRRAKGFGSFPGPRASLRDEKVPHLWSPDLLQAFAPRHISPHHSHPAEGQPLPQSVEGQAFRFKGTNSGKGSIPLALWAKGPK